MRFLFFSFSYRLSVRSSVVVSALLDLRLRLARGARAAAECAHGVAGDAALKHEKREFINNTCLK